MTGFVTKYVNYINFERVNVEESRRGILLDSVCNTISFFVYRDVNQCGNIQFRIVFCDTIKVHLAA